MPRYLFEIKDADATATDMIYLEFSSDAAVKREAVRTAAGFLAEREASGTWSIYVRDETGRNVAGVAFSVST